MRLWIRSLHLPIYVYQCSDGPGCSLCGVGFEKLQKLNSEPLKCCPRCNRGVQKVIGAPNISAETPSLKEKDIEKKGFTQYRKLEKGVYEKTAGKGPDIIGDKD